MLAFRMLLAVLGSMALLLFFAGVSKSEVVLAFLIYQEDSLSSDQTGLDSDEDGTITARSCQIAETYLRDGLKPGQAILILNCLEKPEAPNTALVGTR